MIFRFYLMLCCLVPFFAASCGRATSAVRVAKTGRHMGVTWTVTVYAASRPAGVAACAAAHAEVARLETILSDYDPASELSRLSAAAPTPDPIRVGDDLWRVLSRAVAFRDATGGAFDPTVGPLTMLWRRARRTGTLPPAEALAAARAAVGGDRLRLHPDRQAVSLVRPAMRLDLGGIGMGDAADRAVEVLRRQGVAAAMIDASGDIVVFGVPPGKTGWRVASAPLGRAEPPAADLVLTDAAVTTSGDAFQAVTIDGVRYGHVVDPRTGLGVAGPAAVTVIGPDCTTADALATAALVLGQESGLRLVDSMPGCSARFVWTDDTGATREATSPRWPSQPPQTTD
jgi:thiamine biosynthesis lipoprotein